jgi:chemotaxis protein MotA
MDLSIIIGLVLALGGFYVGIVLEGGNIMMYVGISAFTIIAGGTIGALCIATPMHVLMKLPQYIIIAITEKHYDIPGVIKLLVSFSEKARREGILSLEAELANIKDDFLRQGVQLVIDGTDPALVRDTLETKITYTEERHHHGIGLFETAGGFAPTMGIIGTVLGLVNVLSNLSQPETLGGAIALAFICTLYGIFSANVIFLPTASKLKHKHKAEQLYKEILLEGILCLQSGDNPRMVEQKLKAFLSAGDAKKIESVNKQ